MKKALFLFMITSFFISFFCIEDVFSWGVGTHKDLSKFAVENSVLSVNKDNYIQKLGINNGLLEELELSGSKLSIKKWIEQGAAFEDSGSIWDMLTLKARFFNHFHDPTKSWDTAGLDDWIILPPYHVTGQSSILWAQDGAKQESFPAGDWSWMTIREYYYIALTGKAFDGSVKAINNQERNEYYAQMFRGLGHQMHLIQDAAIPEHVRNDAHPEDALGLLPYSIGFEKWSGENRNRINSFASNPVFPDISSLKPSQMMLDPSYQSRGLAPSALFIDTDQYNGSNPSTSISIGLAEYTNANFFSNDTIFAAERHSQGDRHFFPYPKDSSTNLQELVNENPDLVKIITGEDNVPDTVFSIKKDKHGEQIDHFLRMGYFGGNTSIKNAPGDVYWRTFYRDEQCHEHHAEKLVPRAVGYSARLLDYFFRGDIYLVEDGSAINTYKIKNNSSEDMDGTFELYYDSDDGSGNLTRTPITSLQGHAVSLQGEILAGDEGGQLVIDNFPTDFPPDKKGEVFLVFRGTMGEEHDAVAGRKDKVGYLGPLGYYIREQSNDYIGQTDGSLSSCDNNGPDVGELKSYGELLQFYQKKFSNGTESFYLIKEEYVQLDTVGHRVVVYDPVTGFNTLASMNFSTDASFNVSDDLQNIYVAIQDEFSLTGYKFITNDSNWILNASNSWSAELGYVKKDGTIVATRWQNGNKEKIYIDIQTGSLTVLRSDLYLMTNNDNDDYYSDGSCGGNDIGDYDCFFNNGYGYPGCGKNCDQYSGTNGSGLSTVWKERFLYYRSGGTGDYIEDLKTRVTTYSLKKNSYTSLHYSCSEIDDDECSNTTISSGDQECEASTVTDFWAKHRSDSTAYTRNSSGSQYIEKTWYGATVNESSWNASCKWNGSSGGAAVETVWSGKDYWKFINNSSSSGTKSKSGDPNLCPQPICNSGGNFNQFYLSTVGEYDSETSSDSHGIETPFENIDFGSIPPDQFVFFYLEDAYENSYIEGIKYLLNGTWHLQLYMNGKPFHLLSCTGSTAEEFQFPILLH